MSSFGLSGKFWEEHGKILHDAEIILDLGGGTPFSGPVKQKNLHPESMYVSIDTACSYSPHVAGDVMNLPLGNCIADVVLSSAVLEHIPSPQKAVDEMYRVLRKGGHALGYVPFMYPYHASPSDYFRFTHQGLEYLFREYSEFTAVPWGNYSTALIGFLSGFNLSAIRILAPLGHLFGYTVTSIVQAVNRRRKQYSSSYKYSPPGYFFRAGK